LECSLLNGILFVGSVLFLDYFASPLLSYQQVQIFLKFFESLKMVLWIIPVYVISLLLSSFWHTDIANILLNHAYKSPELSYKS
jgi:hypothetical protein